LAGFNLVKSAWESGILRFRNKGTRTPIVTFGSLRLHEYLTATNVDATDNAMTAEQVAGGIVVHTSVTGGGTATLPAAADIIAALPGITTGETVKCWYINDGDQTVTVAVNTGTTIANVAQTIAINEAALLLFLVLSSTTVRCYIIGA